MFSISDNEPKTNHLPDGNIANGLNLLTEDISAAPKHARKGQAIFRKLMLGLVPILAISSAVFVAGCDKTEKESGRPVATSSDTSPVNTTTAANVDERLFLLRKLELFYSDWPTDTSNQRVTQEKLEQIRHKANRHLQDIKTRNFDETLASLYEDFLSGVDAYLDFLSNIGKIEEAAVARAKKDAIASGTAAAKKGVDTRSKLSGAGTESTNAFLGALIVGGITYLSEENGKKNARDNAKKAAVASEAQRLKNKISTNLARVQNAAISFTKEYSWKKGEAGFDGSDEIKRFRDCMSRRDFDAALQILITAKAQRPRDPFPLAHHAYISSSLPKKSIAEMRRYAEHCIEAARLVPSGDIYDGSRNEFLWFAGDIIDRVATEEIGDNSWATTHNETAAYAVKIWDKCLEFNPADSTGEIRERQAWALFKSGDFNKALEQANAVKSLRGQTQHFAYNMACLLSVLQKADNSFEWFASAVRNLGYNGISHAKRDPDLAFMRKAKEKEFNDLVEVRFSWAINYGVFKDDIILKNESAFPITDVVLSVNIKSKGHEWNPVLKALRINAGETYKWESIISIPGSQIDSDSASLSTEQNR
jgi:hypothetical protein